MQVRLISEFNWNRLYASVYELQEDYFDFKGLRTLRFAAKGFYDRYMLPAMGFRSREDIKSSKLSKTLNCKKWTLQYIDRVQLHSSTRQQEYRTACSIEQWQFMPSHLYKWHACIKYVNIEMHSPPSWERHKMLNLFLCLS